jgi:serine/threonine protein kinase
VRPPDGFPETVGERFERNPVTGQFFKQSRGKSFNSDTRLPAQKVRFQMILPIADYTASADDYDFHDGTKLGEGAFGTVFRAVHKTTSEIVAIKFLKNALAPLEQTAFIREIGILVKNDHPAALRLIGYSFRPATGRDEKGPFLITPVMPHGTMNQMLALERQRRAPPEWNPTTKTKCVFGIVAGMVYMHSKEVMHRDLKPENVFLNDDWEPVIADFGISKCCMGDVSRTMGTVGSPLFLAPEVFGDEDPAATEPAYGLIVDVYSFGMLLYMIFSPDGNARFELGAPARSAMQLMRNTSEGKRWVRLPNIPDYYWTLIESCWSHSPQDRPTFEQIAREFRGNHRYVFDGADLDEVKRYEAFITEGDQKPDPLVASALLKSRQRSATLPAFPAPLISSARSPRKSRRMIK